jgi:hypothetical protein
MQRTIPGKKINRPRYVRNEVDSSVHEADQPVHTLAPGAAHAQRRRLHEEKQLQAEIAYTAPPFAGHNSSYGTREQHAIEANKRLAGKSGGNS